MWFYGGKGSSGFSSNSTAEQVTHGIDGTGLTAIVTGASSGLGKETARVLALRGVHVVMAVRNVDSGRKVKDNILEEVATATIDVMELDLSSMASIRKFALEFKSLCIPLNILVNNAGVALSAYKLSEDNIELQFATNYLGHFLLTNLLLETMKTTASESGVEGRIINVSSMGHRLVHPKIQFDNINNDYMIFKYGSSKLANILHANELTRLFKEEGVNITANSLHPGTIVTNIAREWGFLDGKPPSYLSFFNGLLDTIEKYLFKNVQQGAATTCYVALHPQVKGVSGEYFSDCNISKASSLARDSDLAKKLWGVSLSLTHLN